MSTMGVDTGGTFTDLIYLRDDNAIEVAKRPSTPPDFSAGVIDVVDAVDKGRNVLRGLDYFLSRHHRGDERHDYRIRCQDRVHHHRRAPRRTADDADHRPVYRPLRNRAEAVFLQRQADADRAQDADKGGARADRLQGVGRAAAQRGERPQGRARARGGWRAGDRRLLPVVVQEPQPRTTHAGDHSRGGARHARVDLERHRAGDEGVRALGDDGGERTCRRRC